jgi:hypothetical protein
MMSDGRTLKRNNSTRSIHMAINTKRTETLNKAISEAALKKITSKSTDHFVEQLKEQGIGSLEDLAKALIETARSGLHSGIAFDPEDFPICYKFTTYRPRFDQTKLENIVSQIDQQLLH